jgi:16S rRNA (guanine527-N7)-methyltransferase
MPTASEQLAAALQLHAPEFELELKPEHIKKLQDYYSLILKWNPRLHLVAPCSPEEFAVRHILESLILLKYLPLNVRVADIGAGAGLPLIPCLLVRDDLHALLIEASRKKAMFLKEAVRAIQPAARTQVLNARFEDLPSPDAQFITCRALDKFSELLPVMLEWAPADATLALFGGEAIMKRIEAVLSEITVELIPRSEKRFLVIGRALKR